VATSVVLPSWRDLGDYTIEVSQQMPFSKCFDVLNTLIRASQRWPSTTENSTTLVVYGQSGCASTIQRGMELYWSSSSVYTPFVVRVLI